MGLEEEFKEACAKIEKLPNKPTNEELCVVYGLFKQATVGDVNTARPGLFDFVGKRKWDAWEKIKGKSKEDAMRDYIAKANILQEMYGGKANILQETCGSSAESGPFDPLWYELLLLFVRRSETPTKFEWKTTEKDRGLFFEQVGDGLPFFRGDYLFAVNGRRIFTEEQVQGALNETPDEEHFGFVVSRRRRKMLEERKLLRDDERELGCDYVACRLDPTRYRFRGSKIGWQLQLVDKRMTITGVEPESAASACGLQVGDRLLRIGCSRPRDADHLKVILTVIGECPIDILVARPWPELDLDEPEDEEPEAATATVPEAVNILPSAQRALSDMLDRVVSVQLMTTPGKQSSVTNIRKKEESDEKK